MRSSFARRSDGDAAADTGEVELGFSNHAGWLEKRGALNKAWQRRWFVYKGATGKGKSQRIDYFANDSLRDRKGKISLRVLKGTVPRAHPSVAPGAESYDIDIVTGERTWSLRTDNLLQQQKWIAVINGAAALASGGKAAAVQAVTEDGKVPGVFLQMTAMLKQLGYESTEGIFRVPGEKQLVETTLTLLLEARKRSAGPEVTQGILAGCTCVHAAASLLRMWLRKQPPIIPRAAFPAFEAIVAQQQQGNERIAGAVQKAVGSISPNAQALLRALVSFLQSVDPHATKMSADNLGMVFAPTLLCRDDADPMEMMMHVKSDGRCISLMLQALPPMGEAYNDAVPEIEEVGQIAAARATMRTSIFVEGEMSEMLARTATTRTAAFVSAEMGAH
eukprot:COSAG05_NODE_2404_length_3106_cov_123.921849_2_plen_391_part_00